MKPLVHLNGTGREQLAAQYESAALALTTAIDALMEAAPNARDYYPLGPDAFSEAQREHASRLSRLLTVKDELSALWEHVEETR
jgi:hypothetical protein